MYTIDKPTNRIRPIEVRRFSDLGFKEREHLQEWLAHLPDALGEELLIIQKEFDGFDDTKERLDLLALDKDGNLVIIENKLDDSGRDVVWQALKYASYCASLSKAQIVEIYQQYLARYQPNMEAGDALAQAGQAQDAATRICEFLDAPELDEVKLNLGNSQRIMLVAANFRKEVTSTALWLLGQGINVQCFKVTPFEMGEQLLLNIDQIIPTPEAKELMIGINAKEADEKSTEKTVQNRHTVRRAFWEQCLEEFRSSSCDLYNNISASKENWLTAGSGISGCTYNLVLLKKALRVELWISKSNKGHNKALFDELIKHKEEIEAAFGAELEWMRLDDKKACRIHYQIEADGYNKETWPTSVQWYLDNMSKLKKALKKPLGDVSQKMKMELGV